MTAELVRGQNHPLSRVRLEIRISAQTPVLAGATLGDEHGTVPGAQWVAHPGVPVLPGVEVSRQAAENHRLAVDLAALPESVHRLSVLLALPTPQGGGPPRFGAVAAPRAAVTGPDGTEIARFTLTGLDAESAVVALEVYRRQDAWKVRAVGQGYAGGLAALFADQGLPEAGELATRVEQAAGRGDATPAPHPRDTPAIAAPQEASKAPEAQPAQPVAGDAAGWSMEERLYNQVWGMFEDLARCTAAYRGAVDFAGSRLEKELDQVLADPRARLGTAGDAAREAARSRHTELVGRARAALDRDLAQLTAEAEVVEPALPQACARWESPVWHAYRVPDEPPMALRLGDLHLPESASLRIPMLVRLPLERPLWIDSGPVAEPGGTVLDSATSRRLALETAVSLAVRLLAVHPAGQFSVRVIDPAGAGAEALAPLTRAGALEGRPATAAADAAEVLGRLAHRVDLTRMAVRGGAAGALPHDAGSGRQLLIVNDFPYGFDDRAVTRLRYLADEGPAVGVHLLLVADRADAEAHGPLLDPLWRSLMRLTPVPDDHLTDPWVGHAWTYEPVLAPPGSGILQRVLTEVADARTKRE
ncbi:hypothetical protein AQJ66_10335 [Streptomyces bungoensis]|uniref:TerD domain-containing protein n=1 Tax=Streptomyces bungoensis TaxID=285568 RepID=A0A101T7S2_9ACTN|nr:TerD family protein [Streptomyces bungoensis]KUN87339.1 hypothetical protein AQJ66_10335 [Streptomyces bungoensis]